LTHLFSVLRVSHRFYRTQETVRRAPEC
jgi:hypothetical protein